MFYLVLIKPPWRTTRTLNEESPWTPKRAVLLAVRMVLSGDNQGRSLECTLLPTPLPRAQVVTLSAGSLKLLINSSLKCCSPLPPLSLSLSRSDLVDRVLGPGDHCR